MLFAEFLIKSGANVNVKTKRGDTALIWAARRGHLEVVRNLLRKVENGEDNKTDLNARNR